MDTPLFPPPTLTNVFQCSLVGILARDGFPVLANRLALLCQRDETEPENLKHLTREAVYLRKAAKAGTTNVPAMELRVQKRTNDQNQDQAWSLHYHGALLSRNEITTYTRAVVEVPVSETVETFLESLDFEYQFEYVMSGARYCGKMETLDRPIYVHIYELLVVSERGQSPDSSIPPPFQELVVEIAAYSHDDELAAVNKELTQFANRLIPIVNLVNLNPSLKKELLKQLAARQL